MTSLLKETCEAFAARGLRLRQNPDIVAVTEAEEDWGRWIGHGYSPHCPHPGIDTMQYPLH